MIEGRQAVTEDYTVVDLEMTGLTPKQDKIIEIGAVKVRGRKVIDTYGTLVKSARPIPDRVSKLTGITNEMMENGMGEDQAIQTLLSFIGDDVIVGHNISFDYSFLKQWAVNRKAPLQMSACDTLRIARALLPGEQSKKLEDLCNYFQIEREHAHRALNDCRMNQQVFEQLAKEMDGSAGEKAKVKLCPICGQPMRKRNGRFGEFWGCSGFPGCRYTENI